MASQEPDSDSGIYTRVKGTEIDDIIKPETWGEIVHNGGEHSRLKLSTSSLRQNSQLKSCLYNQFPLM